MPGTKKTISYKINKNGFEVESDINETGIVYKPSIKTGPHNKNTEVLAGPIPDYKFVSPITL